MTPELNTFFERAAAAERVGDVEEALMYHRSIPMFRHSRHRRVLEQLAAAKDELTPWARARWVVYQAIRCEQPASCTRRRLRGAMREAVETFHADLLDAAYVEGGDPLKVTAQVMGESWACHQLATHDYGVLAAFLDELVGGDLAEQGALVRSWVGAPMGGYRIDGRGPACTLLVRDLADDRSVDVLDLGAGCLAGEGGTVVGRLVPSGTTPDLMFDTAPLPVDEHTATEVARCRSLGGWSDVLLAALDNRRLGRGQLMREDYELMTDVLSLDLLAYGTRPTDLARVTAQLRQGRDEVGRAAFRVLRLASVGVPSDEDAPYVAAACLNVRAHAQAQQRILAPGQRRHWLRWAELAPPPARARLLGFAEATADAA
jgi:hypothetical protein